VAAWRGEIKEALSFGTEHLSLYQLTIEPATPFAALHRTGALAIPEDDHAAALYETTQEMTEAAGIPAYEISNHARAGAQARHNLLYWRYGSYAGVGPGAHGRLDLDGRRYATDTERLPERWLGATMRMSEISSEDAAREHLLMNLRLAEGLDLAAFEARWGWTPDTSRVPDDLLAREGTRLRATPRGRLVLNAVIAEIAATSTTPSPGTSSAPD
jgi:oxygen-independent coproporphyrinogen-3 oxidase